MVGRQKSRALHTSILHPALCWCHGPLVVADLHSSVLTSCIWMKNILQPPWGWRQWEPASLLTQSRPDFYCYSWHALSVLHISVNEVNKERHMWVKESTGKRRHLPQHADLRPAFGRWTLHKMTTEKTESWPEQHPVDQNTMHLPGENTGRYLNGFV